MKALNDLKEMLEDEIKKITKKGDITPQELDSMYKATDIIKDIETIDAMKEYGEDAEMSEDKYSQRGGSYRTNGRGMNYSRNYSQNDGYSEMMMPRYMPYAYGPVWNQNQPDMQEMNMMNKQGQRGSYDYSNAGRQGRDGDGDGQYSEDGGSYRRGRDARTGRYVSRDGGSYDDSSYNSYRRGGRYSRHTEKERMIEKLETMMDSASSERERQAIMKCIDELQD